MNQIDHRILMLLANAERPYSAAEIMRGINRTGWPLPLEPIAAALDALWRAGRVLRDGERYFVFGLRAV